MSKPPKPTELSPKNDPRALYKDSGVDVAKGDELVHWLQASKDAGETPYGRVVSGIGGFAALFRPDFQGMADPLLVAGTDGVGTKVLLGLESGRLEGLGQDLVAMCVNDLYTLGASPLFFLDYYATGVLSEHQFKAVLGGIKKACSLCRATLLGGETAEMPGLYAKDHFDLAGFVVGVVDGKKALGPHLVKDGDRLYGWRSSGFHSNGYSLLRKWLREDPKLLESPLIDKLMTPTRIYSELPTILDELGPTVVHALAHITGGGISGNLPRVMPEGLTCHIATKDIPTPAWMAEFIGQHDKSPLELEGVFNLGIGMMASVAAHEASRFEKVCCDAGLEPVALGAVRAASDNKPVVFE